MGSVVVLIYKEADIKFRFMGKEEKRMKKRKYGLVIGMVLAILISAFPVSAVRAGETHELNKVNTYPEGKYVDGDFVYDLIRKGTAVRIQCYTGASGKVVIPAKIKGLPVKEIGEAAFYESRELINEIKISEGIEKINNSAFWDCYKLKKVTIAKSVWKISNYAFYACKRLSVIEGGKGVSDVGNAVFCGCEKLTKIPNFPKVTAWPNSNFERTGLKNVIVPSKIYMCAKFQFYGCKRLRRVVIKKAENVEIRMFYESSVREVIIKKGAKIIRREAFGNCKKLKKVVLPKTTKKIGLMAFQNCKSLRKLTIPKSVKKIDVTAFEGCSKKLTIYCKKNSTAHKFAKKNGMKYKLI